MDTDLSGQPHIWHRPTARQVKLADGSHLRLILICIRKGPKACIYLGTCGTTALEVPRKLECMHTIHDSPYLVPNMVNLFTDCQSAVDVHNNHRQNHLAIERAILTKVFATRLDTHHEGYDFVNAAVAAAFHLPGYKEKGFLQSLTELAYRLVNNPVRAAELACMRVPQTIGSLHAPTARGARGSRSLPTVTDPVGPYGGGIHVSINGGPPSRESPHKHVLIPLSQVPGYKGPKQQRCIICNELVSWVCARCTTGPHALVPCHPFSTHHRGKTAQHNCLHTHRFSPTETYRSVLAKLTGISKKSKSARRNTVYSV